MLLQQKFLKLTIISFLYSTVFYGLFEKYHIDIKIDKGEHISIF